MPRFYGDFAVAKGLGERDIRPVERSRAAARTIAIAMAGALVLAGGACALLPERWAVNAPILHMLFGRGSTAAAGTLEARLQPARGFAIDIFARDLSGARFLRATPAGDILVSRPRFGRVELLRGDRDGDGRADGREVVLEDLNRPHGLDLHDGWLYVAETGSVGRVRFDADRGVPSGEFETVVTGLPAGGNHWTRTVRFGPDGWMYVSVGSTCNVCEEDDPRRAAMLRYRPDGSGEQIYATGLRNAVGFDWRPGTGELYATDNGRDLLGDDFPPCELNRVVEGGFYGWPYANGDNRPDPDLGARGGARLAQALPPAHGFRAHTAPLGITFLRGNRVPPDYRGAALVALHGSWNRTRKDGYKVVSLHWDAEGRIEERDFLVGFELDEDVIGRPVDVAEAPDGAVYISDDYAGAIYRVAWPKHD
jgi:glucose/arabinose dehydrogenase